MNLVIIEGPGKRDTLKKYLGNDYAVVATKGHVRDLPVHGFGVNLETFDPMYEILPDKKEIEKELLKMAKKADKILLATDPDREGEAISWHIASILDISPSEKCRIEFNEISKNAVLNAIEKPREIDMNLVNAQQARRVLDRLVGYKLSPILGKKIRSHLSAGRVQSVALKIIVDREREILNFKPEEYWNISAILEKKGDISFKSALSLIDGKKVKITNKEQADAVESAVKGKEWTVQSVKRAQSKSHAPAPFTTSSLQQDALNKLGMPVKVSSYAAQQLYEGVEIKGEGKTALITYIRTDSTRISQDAQIAAKNKITERFGKEYAPAQFNVYTKKNAQDAHEAIRPINLDITPENVEGKITNDAYRLYKLIYERFLASQMAEAVFDTLTVDILCNRHTFRATGKTPVFLGYLAVYENYEEKNEDDEKDPKIPKLSEGESLNFLELKKEQKFTKPPARYTEASLVKAMEENGIGRPATYAPTISVLSAREYTEREGKFLKPTELGMIVTDYLVENFSKFINVDFTALMEDRLDKIAEGEKNWKDWISKFWADFSKYLINADENSAKIKPDPIESDQICEKCGSKMLIREGRYGKFLSCSAYPKCKHLLSLDKPESKPKTPAIETDEVCEKCGSKMLLRDGKYGKYLACSAFPKCKVVKKVKGESSQKAETEKKEQVLTDKTCSKCGAAMAVKFGKYGKFLACSAYPECKNIEKLTE